MTQSMNDPQITEFVRRLAQTVALRGNGLVSKTATASTQAFLEAQRHPGSLVRVSTTSAGEYLDVYGAVFRQAARSGDLDARKSVESTDACPDGIVVEFANGSAVQVRLVSRSGAPVPVTSEFLAKVIELDSREHQIGALAEQLKNRRGRRAA